ncbi:Bifunctional aspartokinase/homoserine dehydrogenase 1 [Lathyrus oleraceus]|uniref:Bifunctional aspartokinase/homoserine dehydrogenase 1 n=1 Tax=Pisum sativum TaxID=3888 RepID=A0A9D4VM01_PEA|nr:Bifunctional aspartokinase/homoserine dehydrogenase 1 [Pisum sativum]
MASLSASLSHFSRISLNSNTSLQHENIKIPESQCHPFLLSHRFNSLRKGITLPQRRESPSTGIRASLIDVSLDLTVEENRLSKGESWSVHKFGGTCMGSSQRIKNVADIVLNDDSERKLVVVSAMSKVTDMMYELITKAQSRDDSYISSLEAVLEKHSSTAHDMLDGDNLAIFLSKLHEDINNLKAMLRAIYIARIAAVCSDRDALQTARHRRRYREAALVTAAEGAPVGERGGLVAVFLSC